MLLTTQSANNNNTLYILCIIHLLKLVCSLQLIVLHILSTCTSFTLQTLILRMYNWSVEQCVWTLWHRGLEGPIPTEDRTGRLIVVLILTLPQRRHRWLPQQHRLAFLSAQTDQALHHGVLDSHPGWLNTGGRKSSCMRWKTQNCLQYYLSGHSS